MGVQSEAKAVCSATVETRVKNQTPITAFLFGHRFNFHLSFLKNGVKSLIIQKKLFSFPRHFDNSDNKEKNHGAGQQQTI